MAINDGAARRLGGLSVAGLLWEALRARRSELEHLMAYPNGHLYLTVHYVSRGVPAEEAQFGLRFDNPGPATQSLVQAAAGPISQFWTATTSNIEPDYALEFLRLAAVGTDGKYLPGSVAVDYVWPSLVNGGGASTPARFPLQVSSVASLTTALPRGRAHRGRIYLPPSNSALTAGYVWAPADQLNRANTLSARLSDLNGIMGGPLTIFSKVGTGTKQKVTGVAIGNRPDVQRRRAGNLAESYGNATLTA